MKSGLYLILSILAGISLQGCSRDMGSFEISSVGHSVTLSIVHNYFWQSFDEIYLVISNLPYCERSYQLFDELHAPWTSSLYLASATEMMLRMNHHFYLFDHVHCHIMPIAPPDASQLMRYDRDIKIGDFQSAGHGRLVFVLNRHMQMH